MNIATAGIATSRCSRSFSGTNGSAAIQNILASNIGKVVTVYTTGVCQDAGGFTGLLFSMGGGAINLVATRSSLDGGYACQSGCIQARALTSRTAGVSLVIPVCHITAVAIPNT